MPNPERDDELEFGRPEQTPMPFNPMEGGLVGGVDRREPTWGDYGRAAAMGGRDIVSGIGAALRVLGEKVDDPLIVENAREIREWARAGNEETRKNMSPMALARMEAAITDEAFLDDIISSIGLKATRTSPSIVASVIPAGAFAGATAATIAATTAAAGLNVSQFVDELYNQTDALSDEDLQAQSPVYAKMRQSMDEDEAREQFNGVVRDTLPIWVGAASLLTGAFGPAAQIARRVAGGPASLTGRGAVGGFTRGAAEGAAAEFVEEGAVAAGSEVARVRTGEQADINPREIILGAAEGAILGGVFGGAANVTGGSRPRQRVDNPAELPSAEPQVTPQDKTQASTAQPSTAPAVAPPPLSPQSNPKTAATPAAPSTVTPATEPVQPRRRPDRKNEATVVTEPNVEPTSAPVVANPAGTEQNRYEWVKVGERTVRRPVQRPVEIDTATAAALNTPEAANTNVAATPPVAPPVAPGLASVRQRVAARRAPPGTVQTGFGPATPTAPVTPGGNVASPEVEAPAEGVPATAVAGGSPSARATEVARAPAPIRAPQTQTADEAVVLPRRAPRVLEDVRPEVAEIARDDAFQQREAIRENIAQLKKQEQGPAGRTDLYGKRGQKRKDDAASAQEIFTRRVPETDVIPTKKAEKDALKARVDSIIKDASDAGITIPQRIDYEGTAPTADHLIWLREVADLQKAFNQKKGASQEQIQSFLMRERAARAGDFDVMKSERRAEGDQSKRVSQGDVEVLADPKATAVDAEDVVTSAPKSKRGAVRDTKSEEKGGSTVRKIELSPEEKAAYMARLTGQQETKAKLAGSVVEDAKFTKEVAKKVTAKEDDEPVVLPKKVTPKAPEKKTPTKAAELKAKIKDAAKRVEPTPSQAKIDANNFTKGHVSIQGLPVTIETVRGGTREGTTRGGRKWSVKMPAHYGEIKRTEGADGDPLDVYIGPKPDSDYVLVIDQNDADTGRFDELKAFVGYAHMNAALEDYVASFSDGKGAQRFGDFRNMTIAEFKEFIKTAQTKRPLADQQVQAQAEVEAENPTDGILPSQSAPARYNPGEQLILEDLSVDQAFSRIDVSHLPVGLRPFMHGVVTKLKEALQGSGVTIRIVSDPLYANMLGPAFNNTGGVYDSNSDTVLIPERTAKSGADKLSYVMLHELGHAATAIRMHQERRYISQLARLGRGEEEIQRASDQTGYGQVERLMAFVMDDIRQRVSDPAELTFLPEHLRQYGFTNPFEFIAEAISNPHFQDTLSAITIPDDLANLLQMPQATKVSAWRSLMEIIRRILGMTPREFSAFEAAISLTERLTYATRQPEMYAHFNTALRTGVPVDRVRLMSQARDRVYEARNAAPNVAADVASMETDPGAVLASRLEENVRGFTGRLTSATTRSLGDPKLLRLRSMTDMATLAKSYFRGNSVRRVVNAIEAIRVSGAEIARQAEPILNDLINAQRKYKGTAAFEQLLGVMHDATMSGAHPDRDLDANTQLGKKSMKGYWGRAQHAELQQRYNALPDDLKAVYQKSLKYFQDQHNQMIRQSLENRVLKALGIEDSGLADRIFNDKATDADKERLGDLFDVVAEASEFKKVEGPYFPLKRFGNFVVRGTYDIAPPASAHRQLDENTFEFDTQKAAEEFVAKQKLRAELSSLYVDEQTGLPWFTEVDDKGQEKQVRVHKDDIDSARRWRVRVQNKHLEFFENRRDAEARTEELKNEGIRVEPVVTRRDDPRVAQGDLLSTHMERLMRRVEARDGFKEMSETQQNEVRRAIEQASYAVLASTRIQTSRIQRRYVQGASKDIIRSTAEYAGSMAGYLARYQHQGELDAALKEMNKEADASGEPRTAMGRSMIRNEIMYRVNQPNIAPTQHNSQWDQWRHRLLVTSFIGHLASPAYSLINATQPAMVTVPIVSARHGLGSTVAAITKAYSDISAAKTIGRGIANTARRARDMTAETNTYVADVMDRLSNSRERAMLNHLIKHGAIDADAGLEIGKLVNQTTGDQWLGYFEGISRQLPLAVESINRFATALAAYRLEMKRNGGDHDAATLYAQEMVEQTQGIYAGTNAPPIFSSPIASIAFQFKKYGHLIYSLLGQQIGKAIRNENPGDRAEALRALGLIVGAHMAMAGTVGLPTEGIKLALLGANMVGLTGLTMDDFEEWQREQFTELFGSGAAEVLTHGIGRALPGGLSMDLSSRLGMQSYLTFGEPQTNEEGDIWQWLGETAAGAPGGMVMDMLQGAGDIANGDVVKGMSKAVPVKVIKDGLKAYQQATEGKLTKTGRQSMDPLTMPEAAMRLFGIQPARAAESQLASSSYYRNTGRLREERSQWLSRYATASPAKRASVWKDIQKWNREQGPDARITFSQLTGYLKRRKDEERGPMMGGMRVTDQTRAIYERAERLYNQ